MISFRVPCNHISESSCKLVCNLRNSLRRQVRKHSSNHLCKETSTERPHGEFSDSIWWWGDSVQKKVPLVSTALAAQ